MTPDERTGRFRRLHERRPLVLPNAWDAGSARLLELAGAESIGTTSAGVSWARGRRDGEALRREKMIEEVRQIVGAVDVPVTADVESGYGAGATEDVSETVRGVLEAGAVGINLEDSPGRSGGLLLSAENHAERISAAREAATAAGQDLFINARTDVYLVGYGAPEKRLEETAQRGNRYLAAGADCVFIPGAVDIGMIAELVRAIKGPVNMMVGPGCPPVRDLGRIGVARVSVGPGLALVALAAVREATQELLHHGTYGGLGRGLGFGEVDGLFVAGVTAEAKAGETQ